MPIIASTCPCVPFSFTVVNDLAYSLDVFWIDYSGKFIIYGSASPGGSFGTGSYTNHVWVLSSASQNKCFTFQLGVTSLFVNNKKASVSAMKGIKCDPNVVLTNVGKKNYNKATKT